MFILDKQGTEVAHPKLEGKNMWDMEDSNGKKFVQEVVATGNNGGGFIYYEWPLPNDDTKTAVKNIISETDPYWGWVVNASTYTFDFNQPAKVISNSSIIVTVAALVIGIIIIWLFANRISNSIRLAADRMRHLAQADLSQEPLLIRSKDETGILADTMNQMQVKLKDMITNISNNSEIINSHSEQLTQAANEVKQGSEQVAATMQELAAGSEKQADHASELAATTGTFTDKMVEASEHGALIGQASSQILNLTKDGSELMESSTNQMVKVDQIVRDSVKKVDDLDNEVHNISQLVEVIKGVADQTNLLALNAAIEAARAGEQGRGFAVVAGEVRKLSEQVASSVSDITNIVSRIQSEFNTVTESLQAGYREVEQGTNQIKMTKETFDYISASVTEMVNNISEMTTQFSEMAASSQEMNGSIQEIAAISQESAAGIEETSAATQQTNSSMEEVAGSAEKLSELAEDLQGLIRRFKL